MTAMMTAVLWIFAARFFLNQHFLAFHLDVIMGIAKLIRSCLIHSINELSSEEVGTIVSRSVLGPSIFAAISL